MAENLLGRPSIKEIYEYPYVVSNQFPEKKDLISSLSLSNKSFDTTIEELKKMMLVLADKEKHKEQRFIDAYLKTISEKDQNLAIDLSILFSKIDTNPLALSEAVDAIQKYRMKMYDIAKSIEENAQDFAGIWSNIANKTFVDKIRDLQISPNKMLSMTAEQFIQTAEQEIINEHKSIVGLDSNAYEAFVKDVMRQISDMTSTKFGEDYKKSFSKLNDNPYIIQKQKEHAGTGKSETIEDIIRGYLFGIINGLSAEIFLESRGVGKSSARVTQAQKTLSNRKGWGKTAIQTDVLEVLSATFDVQLPSQNDVEFAQIETAEKMYEWLNKIDLEEKFILHTSVKDQSTNKSYGTGKSMNIDVRKVASLDARLEPLKSISEEVSYGSKDIQTLIFAIVNAGNHMITHDLYKSGQLTQAITSLCAAYMFEDYIDTFSQLDSEQDTNDALHVYFINGRYYTLSTILLLASKQIESRNASATRVVKIGFKPTDKDEFDDNLLSGLKGRERWEKVRQNTLEHGKMDVKLDTTKLLKFVYGNM